MIIDKFDLSGKTAIVTGCKRGIGKSMAVALAEAGADIIGVSASLQKGSDVEIEIKNLGKNFEFFTADFSNRDSLYKFIADIDNQNIDILVNNAGTIKRAKAAEHSDAFWDEVIEVNLNSQFILSREIGKKMIEKKSGKIIFIASLLSFQGGITVPGYAASKGGVAQLTKALANEWGQFNVNVNAIAPGYIETDNTSQLRSDEKRYNSILERIPSGRWGTPEDLKGAIVFLASSASDYVNGTILTVDGGWMGR
jgi:2-dehydro-3-deoxy-D-gluconate 5-dehydrogenase